jgi:hypothetical protein
VFGRALPRTGSGQQVDALLGAVESLAFTSGIEGLAVAGGSWVRTTAPRFIVGRQGIDEACSGLTRPQRVFIRILAHGKFTSFSQELFHYL